MKIPEIGRKKIERFFKKKHCIQKTSIFLSTWILKQIYIYVEFVSSKIPESINNDAFREFTGVSKVFSNTKIIVYTMKIPEVGKYRKVER